MPLTEVISTTDPKSSEKAASILNKGGVIVYPTETLYGIGALASRSDAVERIFEIKGRPQGKPIPLLVKDMEMLSQIAENSTMASTLSEKFWPGRLTLSITAPTCSPGFRAFRFGARLFGGRALALA